MIYKIFAKIFSFIYKFNSTRKLIDNTYRHYKINGDNPSIKYKLVNEVNSIFLRNEDSFLFKNALIIGDKNIYIDNDLKLNFKNFESNIISKYFSDEERNDLIELHKVDLYGKKHKLKFFAHHNIVIYDNKLRFLEGNTSFGFSLNKSNLYHFFVDILFEIYFSNIKKSLNNFIINENINNKYLDFIKLIFPKINIIQLKKFELIQVENLIIGNRTIYHYHWLRSKSLKAKGISFHNKPAIKEVHSFINKRLSNIYHENIDKKDLNKKILLIERNSNFRKTLNQEQIIQLLKKKFKKVGFLSIDPSKTDFKTIKKLITKSDIIICQAGAALMNVFFSNNLNQKWISWMHKSEKQDNKLYENIFEAIGIKITFLDALIAADANYINNDENDPSQSHLILNFNLLYNQIKIDANSQSTEKK